MRYDILCEIQQHPLLTLTTINNREFQQKFTKDLPKIRPFLAFYLLKTREFQQEFTEDLPMIYQRFTKNKAIFGILPSKNLPKIYHRFTKSTKHLPKAYQNIFFNFGQQYFDTFIMYILINI